MTTTSAGDGTSAGDSGGSCSSGWSWFDPVRKPPAAEEGGGPQSREGEEPRDGGETSSRPVTPVRPVGSSADRRAPGTGAPVSVQVPLRREHDSSLEEHHPVERPSPGPDDLAPAGGPPAAAASGASREPPSDALLIRRTMEEVEPVADAVTAYFYSMLFIQHPHLRELFPASMNTQRDRAFRAFMTSARLIDEPETLTEYLSGLGRDHRRYGAAPEHYPAIGECLIGALAQYARHTWSEETEAAWVRAYTLISQTMIDAAAEDEKHAPAWWNAEIVTHEMRTGDVAVITVRPDQPYPFLAGQYTSLETPWWPRVWRHYSFATAPRPDGLLSFHVKRVPAGWVSSALVNRARQGDVIRLGAAVGSMTVDHASDSGLLCLGGGTGISPIKALIEDVAEYGRSRPVEVFYGARHDHDLYDLQSLRRLEQRHRWLSVRPVVSDGDPAGRRPSANADAAGAAVLRGDLPKVVRQFGPWATYDGYLSGPAGLIRRGVDALREAGVPPHRIRHDSLQKLVDAAE